MTDFKADFKAIGAALDARGFCVVPEFLSGDEIDFLVAEFDASPDYSPPTKTRHAAQHLGDKPVAVKPELYVPTRWDDEKPSKG